MVTIYIVFGQLFARRAHGVRMARARRPGRPFSRYLWFCLVNTVNLDDQLVGGSCMIHHTNMPALQTMVPPEGSPCSPPWIMHMVALKEQPFCLQRFFFWGGENVAVHAQHR